MSKVINLSDSVFDTCSENPEVKEILKDLGFKDIALPGMLDTAGRFMTITKGAAMKKIDLDVIRSKFLEAGYEVIE